MSKSWLIVALVACAGCLSRNTVGVEPSIDGDPDSGVQDGAATPSPGDDPVAQLEDQLFGIWEGEFSFDSRRSADARFEFNRDHTIKGCVGDGCFFDGDYRVTDVLSNGTAIVQCRRKEDGLRFALEDLVISGNELTFTVLEGDVRLRRVAASQH